MIVIELPWPSPDLSPNARVHWARLSGARAVAKQEAMALAFQALDGQAALDGREIPLELEFCYPTRGRRDRDNLLSSCKAQLDGLAEALGVDDSLFEPIILRRGPVIRGGKVIVKIG